MVISCKLGHVSKKPLLNKKFDFNRRVSRWYPTTEPAESSVFKPRSIPRVLRQFVPTNQMSECGSSSQSAHLRLNTTDGAKESAAINAQAFASSSIRLANNFEVGVEVCSTLISQSKQSLDVLKSCDLSDEVKLAVGQLNRHMALMSSTVYDLKSTNNDL